MSRPRRYYIMAVTIVFGFGLLVGRPEASWADDDVDTIARMLDQNRSKVVQEIIKRWPKWERERKHTDWKVMRILWDRDAIDVILELLHQDLKISWVLGPWEYSKSTAEGSLKFLQLGGCKYIQGYTIGTETWRMAVNARNEPLIREFLSCGALIPKKYWYNAFFDVLSYLIEGHYTETQQMLLQALPPESPFIDSDYYVIQTIKLPDPIWRSRLMERVTKPEPPGRYEEAIREAAKTNDFSILKMLVDLGGDPTAHEEVRGAIMTVSGGGQSLTFSSASYATPHKTGRNALYYAILNDNPEMVKYLIDKGANPNDSIEQEANMAVLLIGLNRALEGQNIDVRSENGWINLLKLARARQNLNVIEAMERSIRK
jgi:hypothetical protein